MILLLLLLGEGNGTPLQYSCLENPMDSCLENPMDSCLENPMDGGAWWAAVHGVTRSWTQLSDFTFTFHFHALEKEMATHSSVLAWRIPGMGEPGGLPSMGSHRVGQALWCKLLNVAMPSYRLFLLKEKHSSLFYKIHYIISFPLILHSSSKSFLAFFS